MVVRELTGGVYFGSHATEERNGQKVATDVMSYSEEEIRRIARVAFETARKRRRHVTSVDKANVLDTSRLWRKTVEQVAADYPDVSLDHMYVDNAAMQICKKPSQFDVILTENMFGDILSDEASMITGTIGTIGSSSLGEGTLGMYEPIHGSAPDIAGQDKANPIGTVLAAAMMLKYSFDMEQESQAVENAVNTVLSAGWRTGDHDERRNEAGRLQRNGTIDCRSPLKQRPIDGSIKTQRLGRQDRNASALQILDIPFLQRYNKTRFFHQRLSFGRGFSTFLHISLLERPSRFSAGSVS